MAITVEEVREAFRLFYISLHNKKFSKTLKLNERGERDLLPLLRTYLLGYFGESLIPEAEAKLPGSLTGKGKIDFLIDNVAVEFAVRRKKSILSKSSLSKTVNGSEVRKLLKHPGLALLVLFDFTKSPLTEEDMGNFRTWKSLGKGNHKISAFNVSYFYLSSLRPIKVGWIDKNIRVL